MAESRTYTPSWDLLPKSVRLIRKYYYPFTYLILLPSLLLTFGGLTAGEFITPEGRLVLGQQQRTGLLIMAAALVWTLVNLGPSILFEIEAARGKVKSLGSYYRRGLPLSLKLLGLYLFVSLAIVGGLLLLILPGLLAIRSFLLSPYYMIERKLGIIEAMRASAKASKEPRRYIWGILGVNFAIFLAAAAITSLGVVGLIINQLISFSATFLLILRYADIEHQAR